MSKAIIEKNTRIQSTEKDDRMNFFKKLERRFSRYAVHNLMTYMLMFYVTGVAVQMISPEIYANFLALNVEAILHGQVWRLVTFLIYYPVSFGPMIVFDALMLYLYFRIGNTLESIWGAFRFNVYLFMGILGHILAAFVIYFATGLSLPLTATNLNMSLFLAFAATFPEMQFYLYGILPIKAKWLGLAYGAIAFWGVFTGSFLGRITTFLSLANFVIFFAMTRDYSRMNPKEIRRKQQFKTQTKIMPMGKTHHKCAVCGRTEQDGDDLEFRYCSKCEGNYEYCQDHLYTHQHVTGTQTPGNDN